MGSTTAKTLRYGPCVTRVHTVLPATHTRTIPAFTSQPQGVTALWLVLIAPTHEATEKSYDEYHRSDFNISKVSHATNLTQVEY